MQSEKRSRRSIEPPGHSHRPERRWVGGLEKKKKTPKRYKKNRVKTKEERSFIRLNQQYKSQREIKQGEDQDIPVGLCSV